MSPYKMIPGPGGCNEEKITEGEFLKVLKQVYPSCADKDKRIRQLEKVREAADKFDRELMKMEDIGELLRMWGIVRQSLRDAEGG